MPTAWLGSRGSRCSYLVWTGFEGRMLKSEINPRAEYAVRESTQVWLNLRSFPACQLRDFPD
jgi:hypothetical protein